MIFYRSRPGAHPLVVLGEFDGFHLGHRQLMHQARGLGDRLRSPLVAALLVDLSGEPLLATVEERCWALLASGATSVQAVSIKSAGGVEMASELAAELIERLDPSTVLMACLPAENARQRYPSLRHEFERRGVDVIEVPRWSDPDGQYVTSSRVREALMRGEIVAANDWLGRMFTLTGRVVHGSALGRTIGFPTANLELSPGRLVPMNGVYAGIVTLPNGERHRTAINIGVRPTVTDHGKLLVEAHLLDYDGDLYGVTVVVGFRRWLRHEHRFDSLDELVAQLAHDIEQTRLLMRTSHRE